MIQKLKFQGWPVRHLPKDVGTKCLLGHCVGSLEILIPGWRRDYACVPRSLFAK